MGSHGIPYVPYNQIEFLRVAVSEIMSGQIQNMNDHRTIGGDTSLATGQIILKAQTIHYIIENSLKTTIHLKFALFDSPEMGNLMIPVESPPFRGDQIPKKNDYKS